MTVEGYIKAQNLAISTLKYLANNWNPEIQSAADLRTIILSAKMQADVGFNIDEFMPIVKHPTEHKPQTKDALYTFMSVEEILNDLEYSYEGIFVGCDISGICLLAHDFDMSETGNDSELVLKSLIEISEILEEKHRFAYLVEKDE
jgi:hypothetical protein